MKHYRNCGSYRYILVNPVVRNTIIAYLELKVNRGFYIRFLNTTANILQISRKSKQREKRQQREMSLKVAKPKYNKKKVHANLD